MDKFVIEGGAKLSGEVEISGSKNAALPILTAALLTVEESLIENIPELDDISTLCQLFQKLNYVFNILVGS